MRPGGRALVAALVCTCHIAACRSAGLVRGGEPVARELRAMEERDLWPGFRPESVPVAWFDGARTILLDHPSPPAGFVRREDGTSVFPGRHEAIHANTSTELGGVPTAVASLEAKGQDPRTQAALLVHEKFHVYQRRHHPAWSADEMVLLTYPSDSRPVLLEIAAEVGAWKRVVASANTSAERCWAEAALRHRDARFRILPANAVAYERANELNEGLAAYVEHRALGDDQWATAASFAVSEVRRLGYFTGHAIGRTLDDLRPTWRSELDGDARASLDGMLSAVLRADPPRETCAFDPGELDRLRSDVSVIAAGLERERAALRAQVSEREGWLLEFDAAPAAPFWPAGLDPLNVHRVSKGEVVHTRWIKLSNGAASIEVLGGAALTEGAGDHPLANGIRTLRVVSRTEPRVARAGEIITVTAEHVTARLTSAAIERHGRTTTLRVGAPRH